MYGTGFALSHSQSLPRRTLGALVAGAAAAAGARAARAATATVTATPARPARNDANRARYMRPLSVSILIVTHLIQVVTNRTVACVLHGEGVNGGTEGSPGAETEYRWGR